MFACIVVCTVSPQLTTAATDAETATTTLPVTAMTSQGMCTIKYLLFFRILVHRYNKYVGPTPSVL